MEPKKRQLPPRVRLAGRDGVAMFDAIAQAFMDTIMQHPEAIVNDWSELGDYYRRDPKAPPTVDEFDRWHREKWSAIATVYKVDVSGKYNLLEIFRVIAAKHFER
jgi:hypothetical protein